MTTKYFLPVALAAASIGFASSASALTYTYTDGYTNRLTELNQDYGFGIGPATLVLSLPRLDPSLLGVNETLTSVSVTYGISSLSSVGNITNTSANNNTFSIRSVSALYAVDLSNAPAPLQTLGGFNAIPANTVIGLQVYNNVAPNSVNAFGPFTISNSGTVATFTGANALSFLGTSNFNFTPYTSIGTLITGGGGNVTTDITTTTSGSVTVTYNTTVTTPPPQGVPFEFSPAIGLVALGGLYASSRFFKKA